MTMLRPKTSRECFCLSLHLYKEQEQHGYYYFLTSAGCVEVEGVIFTVVALIKQTRQASLYKQMLKIIPDVVGPFF